MKIKLLNDGRYGDMDAVAFPVEVEGTAWGDGGFDVSGSEIVRVGGDSLFWDEQAVYFWANHEVEVLP